MTTITQTITTLPTAPDPATQTPAQFSSTAAAYVLAQKDMVPQLNTWAGQVNTVGFCGLLGVFYGNNLWLPRGVECARFDTWAQRNN